MRAGRSVLVLEKNDRLGGFVRTEELTLPGFKHDVYAAAHPLIRSSRQERRMRNCVQTWRRAAFAM